jgi:hypothetical protein
LTTPTGTQFRVDYDELSGLGYNTGFVEFHSSQNGNVVSIDYYGLGTTVHPNFNILTGLSIAAPIFVENENTSTSPATGSIITPGGAGIGGDLFVAGTINSDDTTPSTSPATGSIITPGGAGIGGDLFVAGTINSEDTTPSTSPATGSIITPGGAGLGGDLFVAGTINSAGVIRAAGAIAETDVITKRLLITLLIQNLRNGVSAADNQWSAICHGIVTSTGLGLFVAVAMSGVGNRVMTSPDGLNWTIRVSAADITWRDICYGTIGGVGMFVAVSSTAAGLGYIMTSLDGTTWTIRNAPSGVSSIYYAVTFGDGKFVAISYGAGLSGVPVAIYSTDGINWLASNFYNTFGMPDKWRSLAFGNGKFVAISDTGSYALSSVDGINWEYRPCAALTAVNFCDGLFVACGNGIIRTSSDGITWVAQTSPAISGVSVAFGDGIYLILGQSGNKIAYSYDAINWRLVYGSKDLTWSDIIFAQSTFVAVAMSGAGNRVQTSLRGF